MKRIVVALGVLVAGLGTAHVARADRVVLSGGGVIEGIATRRGDKVSIEVAAGVVTVPSDTVVRIEKSESPVSRVQSRRAALPAGDAKARLDLADYCRDHDMRAQEKSLLAEVLEIDPDNAVARARLGYVKSESGWVTQAEAMRAKGLVEHDGQWLPAGEVAAMNREDAQARRANADAEDRLDAERAQVRAQQTEVERLRQETAQSRFASDYYSSPYYYAPIYGGRNRFGTVGFGSGCFDARSCNRVSRPRGFTSHPNDSTSLSVVKVPYRHQ